jgi:alpha-galactosidase
MSLKQLILHYYIYLIIFFSSSILYSQSQELIIPLKTQNTALVFKVNENQYLKIIYFGKKLQEDAEYGLIASQFKLNEDYSGMLNSAYTSSGSRNLAEPAISVTHADGNKSLDLKYVNHQIEEISNNVSILSITLKDPVYLFQVVLYYKFYKKEDVIEQWSIIEHSEKGGVTLHKFASANLHLKAKDFWLTQYHGDWAKEMQSEESKLTHGIKTLDSKLGTRANLFQPSVFMISLDQPAKEDKGTVLYGALEWSGNFKIDLEVDPQNNLRIIAGINNFASAYHLDSNEEFKTPPFLYLLSFNGKGEASRKMHDWARKYKILDGNGSRLTLLNNWEATYFDFDEENIFNLFKGAQDIGVDLFLLDDGWFGNKYPRNGDKAGLGDWQPNREKLPNGISSLVQEATKYGIKFGIWLEPEMVNPKSELYNKHPDWIIKQPERDEYYFRNQLVLDMSNSEVQDFVYKVVDNLFEENPKLAYIKWDCNSVIYNAYSAHLDDKQSHLYIDYVKGLYNVLERIRNKYPKVPMMLCSGGGGRVDYGALQYFTEFWPSDNTDPLERIYMQWEYSYFYPAISISNHVTSWGNQSIKFKTDVAMMGKLGFDIAVEDLKEDELRFVQKAVRNYDSIKNIIWHGDLYRLQDPKKNNVASLMYLDKDKSSGVIFNFLVNNRFDKGSKRPIILKGLNPLKNYRIKEINLYPDNNSTINLNSIYSGDFLMKVGFNPDVNFKRKSVIVVLDEI